MTHPMMSNATGVERCDHEPCTTCGCYDHDADHCQDELEPGLQVTHSTLIES